MRMGEEAKEFWINHIPNMIAYCMFLILIVGLPSMETKYRILLTPAGVLFLILCIYPFNIYDKQKEEKF